MRFHYRASWIFLNLIERLFFGLRVINAQVIPKTGPVIIACNHISYCDPPVVGSAIPREVYFLAKEELFRNPLFAWLIRQYNAIPLRRSVGDLAAIRKAVDLLSEGKALLMFPEGTRSLSGKLLKPRLGIGMIAMLASCPIVPAYVRGTNRIGKALLRKCKLEVRFAEPLLPMSIEFPSDQTKARYAYIAEEVMRRIESLSHEAEEEGQGCC